MPSSDTSCRADVAAAPAAPAPRTASLALLVICVGYFLVILDATVVNVALPAIGRELHGGVAGLQWVVDAYTLSFAGLLLAGGALAERLGGRRVFAAGLALFALASAACGAAPSLPVLIAARLAQGAGAAALVPASLVLLQAAYPTAAGRSRALGAWGSIAGIGAASGPVIGGLLVTTWSWRGVFLISVPFAAGALALIRRSVPASPRRERAVDLPGQLLAIAALALATGALVQAGRLGWTSVPVLAGLAASAAAGAGFVAAERRSPDPMLPLALFRRPAFRSGTAVGLLINLGFYGQLFVLSLFFQDVRGYSALLAGVALLPEAALLVVASTLSGAIMARIGPRVPMLAGLTIGGAGLAGLALAGPHAGYPLLVAPMAAAGFGMALTMPAATASVMEAAPADRGGIASGVVNAARQAGGVLGVALLGTLVSGSSLAAGLPAALAVAAGAFFAGAVLLLMGGPAVRGPAGPPTGTSR
ncbi:MAG TPA: MFS transporter [Streptosporangiaceae bacterium]|jgi:DHA2 family methylenomycin A resistance protein-like MFS transporter